MRFKRHGIGTGIGFKKPGSVNSAANAGIALVLGLSYQNEAGATDAAGSSYLNRALLNASYPLVSGVVAKNLWQTSPGKFYGMHMVDVPLLEADRAEDRNYWMTRMGLA